jgi:O-antigen/teichoic acid export membrane protein
MSLSSPNAKPPEPTFTSSIFRLSKNFLFILAARIIDILGQFAPMFLVPRYLGVSSYGDYGFALAFALMPISFTYLGLDRILTREIARNKDAAGAYLGAAIMTRWLYMGLVFPLVIIAIYLLHLSSQVILGISLAMLAYNFMGDALVNLAMFRAFEKMRLDTLLTVVYQTVNIVFVLLVIYFDFGFIGLFWGMTGAQSVRCLLAYLISCRFFVKPVFKRIWPLVQFFLKETYIFGTFILLNQFLINVELFALKQFRDSYAISMFYAPHTLMLATSIFPNAFLAAVYPLLARAAVDDSRTLHVIYEKCLRLITFFAFLVFIPLYSLADRIIPLVFGKEFIPAVTVFQILCFGIVFVMLTFVFDYPLSAVNKQNSLIYSPFGALAAKLVLSFLLIPTYGYIGAGLSAVGGYLVFLLIGFILASRFIVRLPILRIIAKPAFLAFILTLLLSRLSSANILWLIPLIVFVYCGSLLGLGFFAEDEVIFVKTLLRRIFPKLTG